MVALVGQDGQAVVMGKREKEGAHLFQNTPSATQLATEPRETTRAGGKTVQDWEVAPRLCTPAQPGSSTHPQANHHSRTPTTPTGQCHGRGFSDRIGTHFHGRPFRHTLFGTAPCLLELSRRTMCSLTSDKVWYRLLWSAMIRYLLFCFSANQVNHSSSLLQTSAGCARAQPSLAGVFLLPQAIPVVCSWSSASITRPSYICTPVV